MSGDPLPVSVVGFFRGFCFFFFNDFGGDGAEGFLCGASDPDGDSDGECELEGVECPGPRALIDAAFGYRSDDRSTVGVGGADRHETDP